MFEIPQPPADQQQLKYGRPIIDISETSKALDPLLRICYPISTSKELLSLEEIELALRAGHKFDMELPIMVLTGQLEDLARDRPLEVWGVACRLGLEHVARCAAKRLPPRILDFTVLGDMSGITAAQYFRLRKFHTTPINTTLSEEPLLSPTSTSSEPPATPTSPAITNGTHVLADTPAPDVVCRSVDGVEFRAHITVLSLASPMLREKITTTATNPPADLKGEDVTSEKPELPVVLFDEIAVVLDAVLHLIYHPSLKTTLPSDVGNLTAVLGFVDKYGLDLAQPVVWSSWQAMASTNALRAYCHAIRAGHASAVKYAARLMLTQDLERVFVEELEDTPALAYHRLVIYHANGCTVAREKTASIDAIVDAIHTSSKKKKQFKKKAFVSSIPIQSLQDTNAAKPDVNPVIPRLVRYVTELSTHLRSQPGTAIPALSVLFTEATLDSVDLPSVWCNDCQAVAAQIVKLNKKYKQLSVSLDQAAGAILQVKLEI